MDGVRGRVGAVEAVMAVSADSDTREGRGDVSATASVKEKMYLFAQLAPYIRLSLLTAVNLTIVPSEPPVTRAPRTPCFVDFGATCATTDVARQMSLEALAGVAGLHWTYVGSVERGERNLSLKNIVRIAEALEIEPGTAPRRAQKCNGPTGLNKIATASSGNICPSTTSASTRRG